MTNFDIIKKIEEKLGATLERVHEINRFNQGFLADASGNIIGISLYKCEIKNLNSIIDDLKKLNYLVKLSVTNSQLDDLSSLPYLDQLTTLYLSGNKIIEIKHIKHLAHLTDLDLSDNKIINIVPLENLTNLIYLDLTGNCIKDIIPIKHLSKLEILKMERNKIESLPHWICGFNMEIGNKDVYSDKYIHVRGNPLKSPPMEIVNRGKAAMQRYFEQIRDNGIDFIFEAKLILVGEGGAGKTSLQVRLMDENAPLPRQENRTRGIKIHDWTFEVERKGIIQRFFYKYSPPVLKVAHIWDFGGQDVYYPVHRFFLTENSVFVLMASTRQTPHNFDYWIPTIYQFGGSSPIILGQTCHDGNKIAWNDLGYYLSNPNFNIVRTETQVYHELNLLNLKNEGLAGIKQTIVHQLTKLPHYGKGVPKWWVLVRQKITNEAPKNDCITYNEFKNLCRSINSVIFEEAINIEDCARFMHSLGVILWYADNEMLKDWVVLQPEWAMNAVYKIIDDGTVQRQNGIITTKDFKRLWRTGSYRDNHLILRQMLEVFKIAFPKKYPKGDYILPARLVSIPPENIWQEGEHHLRLEYKYDFMPMGLVNQLSADLSRYIPNDEQVWNNAVNLADEAQTSNCQIVEDFYFRKIRIRAKGEDGRRLVILVMNALQDITESYKGVTAEIRVPCNCHVCIKEANPTLFLYDKLLKWNTGKEDARVTCNESGNAILIGDLLYNVGLPNSRKQSRIRILNKTIDIFLASSFELKNDREQFALFISRENIRLSSSGILLNLHTWEYSVDAISKTRLQDEYNKIIMDSTIFVSLFFTKVGKYTTEEFRVALSQFNDTGKPLIYTYFKNAPLNSHEIKKEDINSKFEFQEQLNALGHFPTVYENIDQLQNHFRRQLDELLAEERV